MVCLDLRHGPPHQQHPYPRIPLRQQLGLAPHRPAFPAAPCPAESDVLLFAPQKFVLLCVRRPRCIYPPCSLPPCLSSLRAYSLSARTSSPISTCTCLHRGPRRPAPSQPRQRLQYPLPAPSAPWCTPHLFSASSAARFAPPHQRPRHLQQAIPALRPAPSLVPAPADPVLLPRVPSHALHRNAVFLRQLHIGISARLVLLPPVPPRVPPSYASASPPTTSYAASICAAKSARQLLHVLTADPVVSLSPAAALRRTGRTVRTPRPSRSFCTSYPYPLSRSSIPHPRKQKSCPQTGNTPKTSPAGFPLRARPLSLPPRQHMGFAARQNRQSFFMVASAFHLNVFIVLALYRSPPFAVPA